MDILLLLLGLGLILAGANFLTDGSAALAQRFRVSEFVIGLTIVAIGTSTPELVVSVLSAIGGQSDVAIGNVVGSNIFNVFVILGLCALVRPLPLSRGNVRRDIPVGLGASLLLLAFTLPHLSATGHLDRIGRVEGIAMLLFYAGLTLWMIRAAQRAASLLHPAPRPASARSRRLGADGLPAPEPPAAPPATPDAMRADGPGNALQSAATTPEGRSAAPSAGGNTPSDSVPEAADAIPPAPAATRSAGPETARSDGSGETPGSRGTDRVQRTEGAQRPDRTQRTEGAARPQPATVGRPGKALWLLAAMIVGGLAGLVIGGELFLRSATRIARHLGVSESVIAITLVAGGTSLPELASSLVSVLKGKPDMALGNIVGSNIANLLLILGLSATIRPLAPGGITLPDILMVVLSSLLLLLTAFTFRRRTIDRWEGALFLAIYGGYLGWLLAR